MNIHVSLFLFVWGFTSHSRKFHAWSLSRESSLVCHTYCDTGHPFVMIISECHTHTFCQTFGSGSVTTCFYELGLSRLSFSEIHRFHRDTETTWLSDSTCNISLFKMKLKYLLTMFELNLHLHVFQFSLLLSTLILSILILQAKSTSWTMKAQVPVRIYTQFNKTTTRLVFQVLQNY